MEGERDPAGVVPTESICLGERGEKSDWRARGGSFNLRAIFERASEFAEGLRLTVLEGGGMLALGHATVRRG